MPDASRCLQNVILDLPKRWKIAMVQRLRYILPVVVLLVFAGWVYSDDLPKPDLGSAIQSLQIGRAHV